MSNDSASTAELRNILADVDPEKVFRLNDGSVIRSIRELYSSLQSIADDTFSHHVNSERNDFSCWVRDVHNDSSLAEALVSSASKDEMVRAVGSRIYEAEKTSRAPDTAALIGFMEKASVVEEEKTQEPMALISFVEKEDESETAALEKMLRTSPKTPSSKISQSDNEEKLLTAEEILSGQLKLMEKPKCTPDSSEEKSLLGALKDDVSAIFSKGSFSSFVSEMAGLFAREKAEGEFFDELKSGVETVDDKKEMMLSHLKKVYR